ncbi:cutinase family protein [Candidatus Saccharibacteria bacterium]|nr:cutinase family protein [Candidatus Saccharibacteria bacterium]
MRGKIHIKKGCAKKQKVKIRYLVLILALVFSAYLPKQTTTAKNCPELRVVFARGSGGEHNTDANYLEFKSTIEEKLKTTSLDYGFTDLDYPAIGVGAENLRVAIEAYVSAGESYAFGDSVNTGVKNLIKLVNNECPNTKYVIGGYSQGAMVVSKALEKLNANKIIYAATFGDPKIYLPEGKGPSPDACSSKNLSDYRAYVPDCQAYKGLLGGYVPYRPESLKNKVGTWCNKHDLFCSSYFNLGHHTAYISDALYEDASKVIFTKIAETFGIENHITSSHDTVILIDSTGSMSDLIDSYKTEALRLAEQTLASGGRVALYDYRDLNDPYQPVEHCSFDTCTLELFESELNNIHADGGGDTPESLLSAAFNTMKALEWKKGATKSLVVLTDANFLSPDRDGISIEEVISLSKEIDPVNFYIITKPGVSSDYEELATATNGKVITNLNELNLLTDYIIEKYETLPPVEEGEGHRDFTLEIKEITHLENGDIKVSFENTGTQAVVVINDTVMGLTLENEITIGELDYEKENILTLSPLAKYYRGEPVNIILTEANNQNNEVLIPKAPNTGQN